MPGVAKRDLRAGVAGDAVRCIEFGLEDTGCWMQRRP